MRDHVLCAIGAVVGLATALPALGDVSAIDSVRIQERRFNDFPDSQLVTVNNYPATVSFSETFGADRDGFANQHLANFSDTGGASDYAFQNQDVIDLSFDVRLEASDAAPRREAGLRFDTLIGGEAFFFVTSDGEVAAFGAFFPFTNFGGATYTLGDTANLRLLYTPGDGPGGMTPATMEYFFNGMSSGATELTNTENGFIDGTLGGFYAQFQVDNDTDNFAAATFSNIRIVPAPGAGAALGRLALAGLNRRRR